MNKLLLIFMALLCYQTNFAQIALNEICYDPVNNDGSSPTGEWIEISCAPSGAIGCYILTDGDWVVQIPLGTSCPASGFYVIGTSNSNQNNPAQAVTVDLDVNTCTGCVVGGGGELILTNSGEFVTLFDGSGTLVDGVDYNGPSATNSPGGTESMTASVGCATLTSITHPATLPNTFAGSSGGNGTSIARITDGTGAWTAQANPTAGATNNATLPVDLIEFTSTIIAIDQVELSWVVMNEKNFSHYELERTSDGVEFTFLERIRTTSKDELKKIYQTMDVNPHSGKNYYRLKLVDKDGRYEYSRTILANIDLEETNVLDIYPNPATNNVNIELQVAKEQSVHIKVLDPSGRVVKTQNVLLKRGHKNLQFDVQDLAKGLYFISIPSLPNKVVRTFIKQ